MPSRQRSAERSNIRGRKTPHPKRQVVWKGGPWNGVNGTSRAWPNAEQNLVRFYQRAHAVLCSEALHAALGPRWLRAGGQDFNSPKGKTRWIRQRAGELAGRIGFRDVDSSGMTSKSRMRTHPHVISGPAQPRARSPPEPAGKNRDLPAVRHERPWSRCHETTAGPGPPAASRRRGLVIALAPPPQDR